MKTQHSLRGYWKTSLTLALGAIVCLAQTTPCCAVDIYISSSSSFPLLGTQTYYGSGTLLDPYYGDYDYILQSRTAVNDSIHLLAGTFATAGTVLTPNLKAGQVLTGVSESTTTIQLQGIPSAVGGNVIYAPGYGITVQNLSVECDTNQANNLGTYSIGGVVLGGDNCRVSSVTVNHATSWINKFETGAFWIGYPWDPNRTTNNVVEYCTATGCGGDTCNGINFKGGGTVQNNSLYMGERGMGINSIATDANYIGNTVVGGGVGFYSDTGWNRGVLIENNTFISQVNYGIGMFMASPGQGIDGILISGNSIFPLPNPSGASIAVENYAGLSSVTVDNLYVYDNEIGFCATPTNSCWEIRLTTPDYMSASVGLMTNVYCGFNRVYWYNTNVHNVFQMQHWRFDANTDQNYYPLNLNYFPADGIYYNYSFER